MKLTQEELELMVHHLTQEVARLSGDKSLLLAKLDLATSELTKLKEEK